MSAAIGAVLVEAALLTSVIVGFQRALLDGMGPEWEWLAYSAVFAAAMFVFGFAEFRRAKDSFEEAL